MKWYVIGGLLLVSGIYGIFQPDGNLGAVLLSFVVGAVMIYVKFRLDKSSRAKSSHSEATGNEQYDEEIQRHYAYSRVEEKYKALVQHHFDLMEKIGMAYTVANNLKLPNSPEMDYVIQLCKEDIALADQYKQYWNESNATGYWDNSSMRSLPEYSSFKRLAIIYEKRKEYDEAIAVCQRAIALGYFRDGTEGQMPGRIARLVKKKGQEAQKLQNKKSKNVETTISDDFSEKENEANGNIEVEQ